MGGTSARTAWGTGTVKSFTVNASSSGNNAIVAGVAGKRLVFLGGDLVAAGAVTATWESSGGAVIDGPKAFAANGGQIYPYQEQGHFSSLVGEGLTLDLTGAVQVGGHGLYAEV